MKPGQPGGHVDQEGEGADPLAGALPPDGLHLHRLAAQAKGDVQALWRKGWRRRRWRWTRRRWQWTYQHRENQGLGEEAGADEEDKSDVGGDVAEGEGGRGTEVADEVEEDKLLEDEEWVLEVEEDGVGLGNVEASHEAVAEKPLVPVKVVEEASPEESEVEAGDAEAAHVDRPGQTVDLGELAEACHQHTQQAQQQIRAGHGFWL